jgi:hypothetical protein
MAGSMIRRLLPGIFAGMSIMLGVCGIALGAVGSHAASPCCLLCACFAFAAIYFY